VLQLLQKQVVSKKKGKDDPESQLEFLSHDALEKIELLHSDANLRNLFNQLVVRDGNTSSQVN